MTHEDIYNWIQKENLKLCTDTRDMQGLSFFAALRGDTFDGNLYAKEALEKGAVFALVDDSSLRDVSGCIYVENVLETLQALSRTHREKCNIPVVVIGGSNGKTTTRRLVARVLAKKYRVHQTPKNFNNHIGVPLAVLSMPADTQIAVFEIGANHVGEHTELLHILQPTHILVTNNGLDHLEGFGSPEGVRQANKEIYDWAIAHDAYIFVDTKHSDLVEDSSGGKIIPYTTPVTPFSNGGFFASVLYRGEPLVSKLFGSFNVENIHSAISVGESFQVSHVDIVDAIATHEPDTHRSRVVVRDSYQIILDCYNANPSSMLASLSDLFSVSSQKKIIIVGDMLELGSHGSRYHKEVLEYIQDSKQTGDAVVCVGTLFGEWRHDFDFHFFQTTQDALAFVQSLDMADNVVFLKGSRGIALEKLFES